MDYHQKYLKYKNKYMLLKQSINNNNLEGGQYGYWYTQISLGNKKLKDVPPNERTEDLCLTAIKKDSLELKYVDPEISNYDVLCEIAFKKNGLALEHVPVFKKSNDFYKLYKIALANNGLALEHVPFLQRTDELCEIAYNNNNDAYFFAPEHMQIKFHNKTQGELKKPNTRPVFSRMSPQ